MGSQHSSHCEKSDELSDLELSNLNEKFDEIYKSVFNNSYVIEDICSMKSIIHPSKRTDIPIAYKETVTKEFNKLLTNIQKTNFEIAKKFFIKNAKSFIDEVETFSKRIDYEVEMPSKCLNRADINIVSMYIEIIFKNCFPDYYLVKHNIGYHKDEYTFINFVKMGLTKEQFESVFGSPIQEKYFNIRELIMALKKYMSNAEKRLIFKPMYEEETVRSFDEEEYLVKLSKLEKFNKMFDVKLVAGESTMGRYTNFVFTYRTTSSSHSEKE